MSDQWEDEGGFGRGRPIVEVVEEIDAPEAPTKPRPTVSVRPPELDEAVPADLFSESSALDALKAEILSSNSALAALNPVIEALNSRLEQVLAENAQLRGQLTQFEQGLMSHHQWLGQFDARLTAVAQQIMGNVRFQAAKLAADCRTAGEPATAMIKNAAAFFEFITLPPPAPQAPVIPDETLPGEVGLNDAQNDRKKTTH